MPGASISPRHGKGELVTARGRVADLEPATDRPRATELPPGVAAVLSVLSSSAVVFDPADKVLMASAAARSFGLVKDGQLMVGELLALVRQVRRDANERLKKLFKESMISEDDEKKGLDEVQKITDQHVKHIDELQNKKDADLLGR